MAFKRTEQGDEIAPFHGRQQYTYESIDTDDSRDRYATVRAVAFTHGGNSQISTIVYHEDWKWKAFTNEEFVIEARRVLSQVLNTLIAPIVS